MLTQYLIFIDKNKEVNISVDERRRINVIHIIKNDIKVTTFPVVNLDKQDESSKLERMNYDQAYNIFDSSTEG